MISKTLHILLVKNKQMAASSAFRNSLICFYTTDEEMRAHTRSIRNR